MLCKISKHLYTPALAEIMDNYDLEELGHKTWSYFIQVYIFGLTAGAGILREEKADVMAWLVGLEIERHLLVVRL